MLNEHIKQGIPIHPAGEWILDNLYIIEEIVKSITRDLSLKKYTDFLGLANENYFGFPRIYVLAAEMVAYTDGKINSENLEEMLKAYQNKKSLNMNEIWNIGTFLQIALIENIRELSEKIYISQMQKYRVEEIINKTIEKRDGLRNSKIFNVNSKIKFTPKHNQLKYTFIEYMSYRLKKYGKKAYPYLRILENEVNKAGTSIDDIIKKEHFDIALKKVSIGNSITSLKTILRINFLEIFKKINDVEDILKQDPSKEYDRMDENTKITYRNTIQEMSKKTKLSEIYIAKKALELSKKAIEDKELIKKTHIGYYLISEGKVELLNELLSKNIKMENKNIKAKIYVLTIWIPTIIFSLLLSNLLNNVYAIIMFISLLLPIENIITKIIQYIVSKIVKPKIIPKLDFQNGIPTEFSTMIVIPTILKSKDDVRKMLKKLEVFYISNKSENLYFALLGDCSSSKKEIEQFDDEVIKEGIEGVKKLNEKYKDINYDKFNFVYRKRIWNEKENCFLGWERKRGLLVQFNEYILGESDDIFRVNTINKIPKIKYIITLDSDTELIMNSGLELIGAMAHILNKPILNKEKDLVLSGHAIIAPRVGISLEESRKSIFTMLYSGQAGTDSYTNAISDMYQDNFDEGIYAGKGIYDLEIFNKVLKDEIKENTVLSHDLLEGCYLRSGFASDIMIMDGYPSNYLSNMKRLYRWIRGDWQIIIWLNNRIKDKNGKNKKNPLNFLSKYKILSNLLVSQQEVATLWIIIYSIFLKLFLKCNVWQYILLIIINISIVTILDIINKLSFKKSNIIRTKSFTKTITGISANFYRMICSILTIPHKAYLQEKAKYITIYRLVKSKKHLLEWETSNEVEKKTKQTVYSYYKVMLNNVICGIILLILSGIFINNKISIFMFFLSMIWIIAPIVMYSISRKIIKNKSLDLLNNNDKEFLKDVAYRTWLYFKETLVKENNFLPPDNYQEDRKPSFMTRTSSTNIGLGLVSVISSYDLKFENLEDTIELLNNMIDTVESLVKWNGHLYNWYNIITLKPLIPKYISSVDSGNFVGYLYVVLQFLIETKQKIINSMENEFEIDKNDIKGNNLKEYNIILKIDSMIDILKNLINNTNFSKLYDNKNRLFSVGFNVEENKLTDSYYDLLASEARQTSLIAIAKKDISAKHWYSLSRTLTTLNGYKGLISWSGTSFEYLMPNINIPKFEGSILDESCKFLIMSQIEYANKLGVPWGFSEAAFNLKDLYNNYQYKAFGIPWLGLKRGLADEIVIASYGSILAINEIPKAVINNLKELKSEGMYNKYGFYESVDYTPTRVRKRYEIVKTYMAHHEGLILLSLNNFFNTNILQTRFMENEEIKAVSILLQERMPENMTITKEEKEKIEKIKYLDYEDYNERNYDRINEIFNISNVISNDKYTVVMDQYGNGFSKYKNIQVNRFKYTDDEMQGILFFIKDIKNKRIWTNVYSKYLSKPDKYNIQFFPDKNKITRTDGSIETTSKTIIDMDEPVEIRRLELYNTGITEETIEITSYIEPILSNKLQDYAHKAFNNLFISFEYESNLNLVIAKRKARLENETSIYLAAKIIVENEQDNDLEFELDKEKFFGRCNINLPKAVENSIPFSRRVEEVTDPIIAFKKIISINPEERKKIDLIISVGEEKKEVIQNIQKFINEENINRVFDISKARTEAEIRYLGLRGKDIETYQRLLSYIIFPPKEKILNIKRNENINKSDLWKYGISGDLPILLVTIKDINDIDTVIETIKAYEYYRTKNMNIDLIILNKEKEKYENYVKDELITAVLNKNLGYLFNINGGIHLLNEINSDKDENMLKEFSAVIIKAENGNLLEQVNDFEIEIKENVKQVGYDAPKEYGIKQENITYINSVFNEENLKFYNEYGGFSQDGKKYLIKINKNNKLPTVWSNILANERFGTLVTESLGGYTWSENCRLKRLTAWLNNQVQDIPSEIIYIKNMNTGKKWSMGFNPMPDDNDYYVTYGYGYSEYIHFSEGIEQKLTVFVPKQDNIKVNILHLENREIERKELKIIYYIKPVLGEDEIETSGKITLEFNEKSNIVLMNNITNNFKAFISSSERIESYTGSRTSFLGKYNISNPIGLDQIELSREDSYGKDSIVAIQFKIKLDALSSKDISIILGDGCNSSKSELQELSYKYSNINNCRDELDEVKKYWEEITNEIQISTPSESMNILANGWLIYQTISSRLYAKTGFYQSGGAYGFRDQLQDVMAVKYFLPSISRQQIIKHSEHQFLEGDVEHWWHEENSRGIRTRFSDDRLWLAYVTADYIKYTGDYTILDEISYYRAGDLLKENEQEKYDLYKKSEVSGTIYEHCIKAIDKSLNFGINGLPLIGSGDWNDGFSNVGIKGKGESVWLGFFLYDVLSKFISICDLKKDEPKLDEYVKIMEKLKKMLNSNGWDGRWYRRAFMDNGEILGSLQNEECRIDSISQSWATISGAGDNDKKFISLESLDNHLVDRGDNIIKLIDPPFEKSKINPGYIKAYVPGTRENGGQYTHGAIWAIIANAMLNLNDKAFEYFKMINPIEHTKTKDILNKYKVEPYVIAADVYGANNLKGRGGWTWYTGSSSWMYIAIIKYMLGLNIESGILTIDPHIPDDWSEYCIKLKYKKSIYNIKIINLFKGKEKKQITINGKLIENNQIQLNENGDVYLIEIRI